MAVLTADPDLLRALATSVAQQGGALADATGQLSAPVAPRWGPPVAGEASAAFHERCLAVADLVRAVAERLALGLEGAASAYVAVEHGITDACRTLP